MQKKLHLIFILIFLSFSDVVLSNTKNIIEEDQKTLNILKSYLSKQIVVGKANFKFLFWNMYDAKLITETGDYP